MPSFTPDQVSRIETLLREVSATTGKSIANGDDAGLRFEAVSAVRNLQDALQTPEERLFGLALGGPILTSLLRIAVAMGLFKHLGPDEVRSTAELAKATGGAEADLDFLARLLRYLAATGVVVEAGPDRWRASQFARALGTNEDLPAFLKINSTMGLTILKMPEFFADRGYANPASETDCPFNFAHDTPLSNFAWLNEDPERLAEFRSAVLATSFARPRWEDPAFYPVQARLVNGYAGGGEQGVLLVDVGGGIGLDASSFKKATKDTPGRVIVQDQQTVLALAPQNDPPVEMMEHDFFAPQPVKGARAYYLHRVFHDWSDEKSRAILAALRPAMTAGYSRLLIQEVVVPAQGADTMTAARDWLMMASFAARERTEADWRGLLEGAGFAVTGMWTVGPGEETVIEAVVT